MAFIRTATVCVCLLAMSRLMTAAVGEAPLRVLEPSAAFPRLGEADDRQDELDMLPPVPEDVECYQALVEKVAETSKRLVELEDRAHVAMVKFNHTSELKETSVVAVAKLEKDAVEQKATMDETKQQYDKDHVAALSTYELARQALNRYNDLKKKGEDDVTLSQEEMAAYLKYKEMSLKAAEEGKDEDTKRYQTMSNEHLGRYKNLESSIKESLDAAQGANTNYQKLSGKYDEVSKGVAALEVAVTHKTKEFETTNDELEHQKAIYDQAVEDSTEATAEFQETQHKVTQTKDTLQEVQTDQIVANTKFHAIDKKIKRLKSDEEASTSKMGKYREISFQFETKAKKMGEQATEQAARFKMLKEKHRVAQSATQAFSQAYEHAGCGVIPHEAAARAQKAAQMEEAKDAAGMAFQLAEEELKKAKKLRDAAMADAAEEAKETTAAKETRMAARRLLFVDAPHELRLRELSGQIYNHAVGKHIQSSTHVMRWMHAKRLRMAQDGLVILLQESISDSKQESVCDHTKQLGTLDFNAMEEAATERDRHQALEKEYRRKEASNLSGITSTSVILKNLESKVGNLKSEIAITNEVRKNPCDPPKAAATDAIKSNTTSIDESSIENEVVEENGAPTRYNAF